MTDPSDMADSAGDALVQDELLADTAADDLAERTARLDPDEVFGDAGAVAAGSTVEPATREARFDGDTGELPAEACWALQELVGAPHVSAGSRHWPVVLQYEDLLHSRLSELGLLLEINHERRFAFTKQADDPSPRSRKLLRAKTLSLAASALALHLYQQYLVSASEPIVEKSDLLDHMLAYKPAGDTDEAGFEKKVHTAIRSLEDAAIIKRIDGTERYLIHSVITSIITAEQVTTLDQRYRAIARGETLVAAEPDDEPDDAEQGEPTDD